MLNKAQLIGNLGADPDLKNTNSGLAVCKLRIATNERVKKGDNWEDHVEWHSVVCFGKTAENVQRFLRKGSKVYVEGKIRTNKWQDRDGNDRWTTEILADQIRFLDSKRESGGGDSSGGYGNGSATGYGAPSGGSDDDIPF